VSGGGDAAGSYVYLCSLCGRRCGKGSQVILTTEGRICWLCHTARRRVAEDARRDLWRRNPERPVNPEGQGDGS
jgi:hypothetical protein